ncbi:6-phosphofructokinase [Marvinbryantia formatexigens]|nr:6-phosphofructokinase [Marvinbryantia formatexigens]UWO24255.1 6-phosphofructokinase [Marvinbryantia formatexigens DSM 14469]SDF57420.1 6-phosphofructokinase 1 [Marvinbryantia formatexigens]
MGMNILVAHGGGPTAVINTSLQGVVEAARASGRVDKIYAARFGAEGILKGDLMDLTEVPAEVIARLRHTPASAIGSCRRKLTQDDYPTVLETIKKFKIDAFFYNGGNDSMDTCNKVNELAVKEGLNLSVIGIPKTMDNDLEVTDHCPGFGSAARYAAISASELALDASGLPIHVVVLELMGRNAGWVTAAGAMARRLTRCGQLTYLPEVPVDMDRMLADIEAVYAKGNGLLVTVSEGVCGPDGKPLADTGIVDGFGHVVPGGTAQYISGQIMQKLGIKSRAEKPGLLGRCSIPYVSPVDSGEAYEVGRYALESALRGESGQMVAIEAVRRPQYRSRLFLTPLSGVANAEKRFPLEWIVDGNQIDDAFFDYAKPLMGEDFPQYAFLR